MHAQLCTDARSGETRGQRFLLHFHRHVALKHGKFTYTDYLTWPDEERRELIQGEAYERSGVREYLVVEPEAHYVERFVLEADGAYGKGEIFGPPKVVRFARLPGIELRLAEVFELEP